MEGLDGRGLANAEGLRREIGWGGRIRTFTVLINSEVSYQLDHAPAGFCSGRFGEGRRRRPELQSDEIQKKDSMGKA